MISKFQNVHKLLDRSCNRQAICNIISLPKSHKNWTSCNPRRTICTQQNIRKYTTFYLMEIAMSNFSSTLCGNSGKSVNISSITSVASCLPKNYTECHTVYKGHTVYKHKGYMVFASLVQSQNTNHLVPSSLRK